jgi:hypothetical protein
MQIAIQSMSRLARVAASSLSSHTFCAPAE